MKQVKILTKSPVNIKNVKLGMYIRVIIKKVSRAFLGLKGCVASLEAWLIHNSKIDGQFPFR